MRQSEDRYVTTEGLSKGHIEKILENNPISRTQKNGCYLQKNSYPFLITAAMLLLLFATIRRNLWFYFLGFLCFWRGSPIFSPETLHSTGGIHQFLLSGEKRVTSRADFHADILHRRAGVDHVAAGAGDVGVEILGMNLFFHLTSSLNIPPKAGFKN
jgi:hypothetical protein